MRLRRETGDFQIKIDSEGNVNAIRKGLTVDDLIGEVVDADGERELITHGYTADDETIVVTEYHELTYDSTTGEITSSTR